ncbi:MAG: hypothetical protein NT105_11790 [Verrucomicrobia bacterium]|nr:hypothetical protein [Verrucomicrobiota bacterium]
MSFAATVDIGIGQVILVLLVIILVCWSKQLPNLARKLQGAPCEEEPQPDTKRFFRWMFLIACASMIGYAALCIKDGTFSQLISSLRK